MKIGSGIAMGFCILTEIMFLVKGLSMTYQFEGGFVSKMDLLYLFYSGIACLLSVAVAASFSSAGMKRLVKNMQTFRPKTNFCYSCGESIQAATTADLCPTCNSKINMADVIDA